MLFNLRKRGTNNPSNVTIRGVSPIGLELRPEVKLAAGRLFRPGSSEIITGRDISQRFAGAGLGETLRFAMRDWTVVGVLDAGNTAFSSEIWGDIDQMQQAFRRPIFSTVIMRLRSAGDFDRLKQRLESDPRLPVQVKREITFYEDQSKRMADFIRLLGLVLTIIFSLGAVTGGHDHHVCGGGQPDRGDRHVAGSGLQPGQHPDGYSAGIVVYRSYWGVSRIRGRLPDAVFDHLDHQLADIFGSCL